MASFSGIYGTAIRFPYRIFVIPWVKRSRCISCAKGRDYSSSFPVKYVPRKFSKTEENEGDNIPAKYSEQRINGPELNVQRDDFSKNSRRSFVNIESKNCDPPRITDMNYGLNLETGEEIEGDFMAVNDEFIEEPDEIVEDNSKICLGLQTGNSLPDVEKSAIQLLASRAYTALELKKKLQGKRYPLEIVDAVLTDFQIRGLINDCLYAETFSRSRWSSSSWGPRRIKQALFKKGVSEVDAEKAIKLVFGENEEADRDQNSGIAMSKLSIDQLYVQASKQWQRSHGAPQETRKSRIVRWLQYRGFNWSVIKCVLKRLESEFPS
ncbi:hypothetical protein BUALT_Bualt03G0102500 [Buddleja alternifolia]|uniref:Regulatory protein RecX n=1 Tax=Buddleja alternifolia TaxID=168488 RepID=A0AAV6Y3C5_9LAMI|nr:hypothetical protein BUALT_Bualt03G0102500 [Buddleja alternifolia]